MNRIVAITVDDLWAIPLTVNDLASNIDILGYSQGDVLTINFTWTSAPAGTSIVTATFEARNKRTDAFGSGPINVSGTITLDGSLGTVAATFVVPLSALTPKIAYWDFITITDAGGNTKEWTGLIRALP